MHGKKNGALGSIGPLGPRFFLGGGETNQNDHRHRRGCDEKKKRDETRRNEIWRLLHTLLHGLSGFFGFGFWFLVFFFFLLKKHNNKHIFKADTQARQHPFAERRRIIIIRKDKTSAARDE